MCMELPQSWVWLAWLRKRGGGTASKQATHTVGIDWSKHQGEYDWVELGDKDWQVWHGIQLQLEGNVRCHASDTEEEQ